jgi:hypothetical protein
VLKLVALEVLIVTVATRAMLALIGKPPPLPDAIWAVVGLLAALTTAITAAYELVVLARAARREPPRTPRVPLERIGPYRSDQVGVRLGRRERIVNLN